MNRTNAIMLTVILSLVAVVMPGRIFQFDGELDADSSDSDPAVSTDSVRAFISAAADLSQEWIPARGATPVTARLRIEAPYYSIRDNDPRQPTDLVALIDLSRSLSSEEYKQACLQIDNMRHYLSPGDRFAIIATGNEIEVVRSLKDPDTDSRVEYDWSDLRRRLARGDSLGGSGMIETLNLAAKILSESYEGRRRQVFLFSDGSARAGSLDGELLRLGQELNRQGIAVTTFGLGHDFDVERLIRLASVSGGGYAHVAMDSDGARLQRAVRSEWGRVVNRTLDSMRIVLDLETGVRFVRAMKHEAQAGDQRIEILSPTLAHGEARSILLDLEVDASMIPYIGNRADSLVKLHISYAPPGSRIRNSGGDETLNLSLGLRLAADDSHKDMRQNTDLLAERMALDADLDWAGVAGRLRFGAVACDGVALILRQKAEELDQNNRLFRSPVIVEEVSALRATAQRIENRSFYFGSAFGEATFGQDRAAIAAGEYQ